MRRIQKEAQKGDPSAVRQHFPVYNLKLLCCRFWALKRWEYQDLSFPYWRVYHNRQEGATMFWKDERFDLKPDKIYLIAPNTPYSSCLNGQKIPTQGFHFEGERITQNNLNSNHIQHLFIHFNLGIPYDNIAPGIIEINVNEVIKRQLKVIKEQLLLNAVEFSFFSNLTIRALVNELLCAIPKEQWLSVSQDSRIMKVLGFIEENMEKNLSNEELAQIVGLATNSFTRLFKQEMNITAQRYVRQKRIDKACILLHHSDQSIERMAENCGFADRYHFSRIFKLITGQSPVSYRRMES